MSEWADCLQQVGQLRRFLARSSFVLAPAAQWGGGPGHLGMRTCHKLPLAEQMGVLTPPCPALQTDFRKAKEKVLYKKKEGVPEGLYT